MRFTVIAAAAFLIASAAIAQEQHPPETSGMSGQNQPDAAAGNQAFADPSLLFSGTPGAFIGLAVNNIQGEGSYASTVINTEFSLGPVGVGLSLPLNLLLWNNDQCCTGAYTRDSKTYGGILRRRDWDEAQDYTKLVRFVRYGNKRDPLYVLAGQLWGASIGHGTLVNRYSNSLSLDHPKAGLAMDVNTEWAGVETLTDWVGNPTLMAGRAYVRPFGGTPVLRGWAIGVSGAVDRSAPIGVAGPLQSDGEGNPIIPNHQAIYAGGIDTEYEVLRNSLISLIPYADFNRIAGAGNGIHAGVLADVRVPVPLLELNVQAKLEYRMMQPGYIPEYFDQVYDLGRVQYAVQTPTGSAYVSKYDAAQAAHGGDTSFSQRGYYGELAFGFAGLVQIGGLYQDRQGDPNGASFGLFATVPKFDVIKASAYYLRKNMKSGFDDAFRLDERSLLAASLAYKVWGPVYFRADFRRQWVLQPGQTQITAVDSFTAGMATFIAF
ncbi:MAG: hypothetical protein E6J82_12690 [Deltaproteobacteria bacterium]|nr:MAG: hypothetical protein E6J82_12690 [Deltaproteobacteria bacterium]TMA76590.1 MAG: hypothetical protein E6J67_04250 [Deltaproteobacteria bacterium]TMB39601.1 MAG: hypothetical protein E6J58_06750 [Deltaproteobacteria bacterium]